jgi:hypothetical protein
MIFLPSVTESVLATARPPLPALISATTFSAFSRERSLTTTFAPRDAKKSESVFRGGLAVVRPRGCEEEVKWTNRRGRVHHLRR